MNRISNYFINHRGVTFSPVLWFLWGKFLSKHTLGLPYFTHSPGNGGLIWLIKFGRMTRAIWLRNSLLLLRDKFIQGIHTVFGQWRWTGREAMYSPLNSIWLLSKAFAQNDLKWTLAQFLAHPFLILNWWILTVKFCVSLSFKIQEKQNFLTIVNPSVTLIHIPGVRFSLMFKAYLISEAATVPWLPDMSLPIH